MIHGEQAIVTVAHTTQLGPTHAGAAPAHERRHQPNGVRGAAVEIFVCRCRRANV